MKPSAKLAGTYKATEASLFIMIEVENDNINPSKNTFDPFLQRIQEFCLKKVHFTEMNSMKWTTLLYSDFILGQNCLATKSTF